MNLSQKLDPSILPTRSALLCMLLLGLASCVSWADTTITKTEDRVVDVEALTIKGSFGQSINGLSFQQDAIVTHQEYQYVGYYDGARRVCLARRKLPSGDWEVLRFTDYDFTSNDAHNTISIGVCPQDGSIHLAFDHHGHPLHYRVSRKGAAHNPQGTLWQPSLFGPVTSELEKGRPIKITYPRFLQTPGGGLQFCYRQGGSGNGDRMLVDYDAETGKWVNTRQIDSRKGQFRDDMGESRSRCSYPNGYSYGPTGRLHTTWVWRESSQGSNHDLMYAYSDDRGRSWHNNRGDVLDEPPHVNSPDIAVVNISRQHGLMNTHGQAVDSQDRIHVVMWHCTDQSIRATGSKPGDYRWGPPAACRYHHYWRNTKGEWQHRELGWAPGNRPKLFIDRDDNVFLIFNSRHRSTQPKHGALSSTNDLVIATATAKSQWSDWKIAHVEKGPFLNEMLGDQYRWKQQGILSVMVQARPTKVHQPTPLRILDFSFRKSQ